MDTTKKPDQEELEVGLSQSINNVKEADSYMGSEDSLGFDASILDELDSKDENLEDETDDDTDVEE